MLLEWKMMRTKQFTLTLLHTHLHTHRMPKCPSAQEGPQRPTKPAKPCHTTAHLTFYSSPNGKYEIIGKVFNLGASAPTLRSLAATLSASNLRLSFCRLLSAHGPIPTEQEQCTQDLHSGHRTMRIIRSHNNIAQFRRFMNLTAQSSHIQRNVTLEC